MLINNKFKAQTLTGNPTGNYRCQLFASRALNMSCYFSQSARSIESRCVVMLCCACVQTLERPIVMDMDVSNTLHGCRASKCHKVGMHFLFIWINRHILIFDIHELFRRETWKWYMYTIFQPYWYISMGMELGCGQVFASRSFMCLIIYSKREILFS